MLQIIQLEQKFVNYDPVRNPWYFARVYVMLVKKRRANAKRRRSRPWNTVWSTTRWRSEGPGGKSVVRRLSAASNFQIGTEKMPANLRAFAVLKKSAALANEKQGTLDHPARRHLLGVRRDLAAS